MRRALLLAGVGAAALSLAGCASSQSASSLDSFITTMSKTNCHVTLSTSASVGVMNPGSGAQFQAQADCPNGALAPTALAANAVAVP